MLQRTHDTNVTSWNPQMWTSSAQLARKYSLMMLLGFFSKMYCKGSGKSAGSLRDDCRADSEIENSYKTAENFNLEGHLETFTAFDVHALPVAFVPSICSLNS